MNALSNNTIRSTNENWNIVGESCRSHRCKMFFMYVCLFVFMSVCVQVLRVFSTKLGISVDTGRRRKYDKLLGILALGRYLPIKVVKCSIENSIRNNVRTRARTRTDFWPGRRESQKKNLQYKKNAFPGPNICTLFVVLNTNEGPTWPQGQNFRHPASALSSFSRRLSSRPIVAVIAITSFTLRSSLVRKFLLALLLLLKLTFG